VPHPDPTGLATQLLGHGVLTRVVPSHLRIGVGNADDLAQLDAALAA